MRSQATELGDRYGYPVELTQILDEVVRLALSHLGDVGSIVLSPSASTGDFLWKRGDSGIELLSDVDGFVFMNRSPEDAAGFQAAIAALTSDVGGPMFHVDLSLNSAQTIGRLPNTYQFVETGLAGFVLYGEDVLSRFPRSFDPRASRQAFLLNLFKPLRHAFLLPDSAGLAQATARLILDIPTLAASEFGRCIPGHRARAQWFLDERLPPLGEDPVIRAAVETAAAARENPPGDLTTLEPLLYPAIFQTVRLLDGQGEVALDPDPALVERLASWLPPRSSRRFLGEFRTLLRRPDRPISDLRWFRHRKEASAGAALLGLFRFLAAGAEGAPSEGIGARLVEFSRRPVPDTKGLDFVRSACEVYSAGVHELYPSLDPAAVATDDPD